MKQSVKFILGILLFCVGVTIILNVLHIIAVKFFFNGWWTLFIIIPCLVGLFNDKEKAGPLFGISLGVILLLAAQAVINWADVWKFMLAMFAIIWGIVMIFGKGPFGSPDREAVREVNSINRSGRHIKQIGCSFSHQSFSFSGQVFEGADLSASFGALRLDLRGADILDSSVININCSFAGIEILLDNNVCVKIAANASFGAVEDKRRIVMTDNAKTLYIEGSCSFGGVEIK